jgi:hypothetical protein
VLLLEWCLQDIKCSRGAHNSLSITWLTPVQPGKPPFHKYVLERLPLSAPGAGWEFVADAVDVTRWLDLPSPGVFQYRVVAWNVYGRGPAATSAACAVLSVDVEVVEAPAAGCTAPEGAGSCRRSALPLPQPDWSTGSVDPGDRHTSGSAPQQLRSSVQGRVAAQGPATAVGTKQLAGELSNQAPASTAAHAAAHIAALHAGQPEGADAPSPSAAAAWRALVKRIAWWLWTALNTVLVLVLPACVRLLPVSVLHRVYHVAVGVVARMLLLLGWLARIWRPSGAAGAQGANTTAAGGEHKGQAALGTHPPPVPKQAGRQVADSSGPGTEIEPAAALAPAGPVGWEAGGPVRSAGQPPNVQQQHSRAGSSSSSHNSEGGALPVPYSERSAAVAPRGVEEVGVLQEGSTPVLPLQPLAPWEGSLSSSPLGSMVATSTHRESSGEVGHGSGGQPLVMPSVMPSAASSGARGLEGSSRLIRNSSSGGRHWVSPGGPLPHSSSGGSLSTVLPGEAGGVGHHQWRAVSMVDANAGEPAGTGVLTHLGSSASAPQLQLLVAQQEAGAGLGSHGKKQCAHPGCEQRFDSLRNLGAKRQRHNCGRCLRTVCLAHTAYSTHGASGPCGVQSRCVCVTCFAQFTPEYQMLLAARNTLCAGAGVPCSSRQRRRSSPAARLLGRSPSSGHLQAAAGVAAGAQAPVAAADSDSGHEEMRGLIGGLGRGASGLPPVVGGSRGRLMWARTWTKLHAVHQFNRAARSSQQEDPQ